MLGRDAAANERRDYQDDDEHRHDAATKLLTKEQLEEDRFTYLPRRHEFAEVALLPSDAAPRGVQYELVDRIVGEDGVPEYIVRRADASTAVEEGVGSNPDAPRDNGGDLSRATSNLPTYRSGTLPPRTAAPTNARSSTSAPCLPKPNDNIVNKPADPSVFTISLYEVEAYVSAREIERFENERYKHPRPDDFPHRTPTTSRSASLDIFGGGHGRRRTGGTASAAHSRQTSQPQKEHRGRPSKRRKTANTDDGGVRGVMSTKSVANTGATPNDEEASAEGTSAESLASHPQDDQGTSEEVADSDVDMLQSIEHDDDSAIPLPTSPISMSATLPLHILSPTKQPASPWTPSKKPPKYGMMAPFTEASSGKPSRRTRQIRAESTRSPGKDATTSASSSSPSPLPSRAATSTSPTRKHPRSTLNSKPESKRTPSSQSSRHTSRRPTHTQPQPIPADPDPDPDPDRADGEGDDADEYEISHIITHDDSTGARYYLVAWLGYPDEQATWMPTHQLHSAQLLLDAYLDELARVEGEVGRAIE
jgi:hypothetical protein